MVEVNHPSPLPSVLQNAIANASTLAEVERLKGLLQSGQIPGRERRLGPTDDGEEEMEEDTVTNGSLAVRQMYNNRPSWNKSCFSNMV